MNESDIRNDSSLRGESSPQLRDRTPLSDTQPLSETCTPLFEKRIAHPLFGQTPKDSAASLKLKHMFDATNISELWTRVENTQLSIETINERLEHEVPIGDCNIQWRH